MRSVTLLLVLGLFLGNLLLAQSAEEVAREASQQMDTQRYEQAIVNYESLLTQGYSSADLHYNLGLAHYYNGALGQAILHMEKALKLAPYNGKIEKNLELMRNEQVDGLLPLPKFFLYKWWHNIAARLHPDTWAVLALILILVGSLGLAMWFRYRKREGAPSWFSKWRRRLFVGAPIALLLAMLFILFANSRCLALARADQAVLLAPEISLYATPDDGSNIDETLHEGLRVRILDKFEDWTKIELVDGRAGWLKSDQLDVI